MIKMKHKIEIKEFELNLGNQSKFIVAGFERKIYSRHLGKIREAIKEGNLHDTVITVIPENNRYRIIDGQHRFAAMVKLLENKDFKDIPIFLRIVNNVESEESGREVYLALDSGKPLTIRDILKIFDDGKHPFFNLLRTLCNHYGTGEYMTYAEILAAYEYAISGDPFFSKDKVKDSVERMTQEEVYKLAYVLSNIYTVVGRPKDQFIYKSICFRNIVKVIWENPVLITKQGKFQTFLKKVANDSFLQTNSGERAVEVYAVVYNYMMEKLR